MLTNKDDPVTYVADSTWIEDAVTWLRGNAYKYIHLFGFSAGGVAVAYEIQKEYATYFSTAVIASAPVNSEKSSDPIFRSARTASKVKVAACFLEGVEDGFYNQMLLYYNNTLTHKEWHDWNGGHDIFPNTCKEHPRETVTTAVVNWYNAPHPPSTPFMPSGRQAGYVYTTYSYSTGTIDPNGNNVRYQFSWGDGTYTTTSWHSFGVNITESHSCVRPGIYNISVRAQDTGGLWSNWSPNLTVTISQNDAGTGGDAGNSFSTATLISTGSRKGTLYQSNPTDTQDWYKFYAASGQSIYVSVTPPSGVDFDLQLYDSTGNLKAGSYYGAGYTDSVSYTADSSGYWRARIYVYSGEGQYSFYVSVYTPGGGGGCPTLYVYDGEEYFCEGLLEIHNPEGVGVVFEHTLVSTPQRVDGAYLFRLVEHPQTHSYIDQVKLYAILEDKTVIELPLIWACHSEDGNVLPQLLHSDEWKADTLGADHNNGTSQSIDLKFAALSPNLEIIGLMFQIEGNNIIIK